MPHPDDRIAKFWTVSPDRTLHAALLFAGATETYCGIPAHITRTSPPSPPRPTAPQSVPGPTAWPTPSPATPHQRPSDVRIHAETTPRFTPIATQPARLDPPRLRTNPQLSKPRSDTTSVAFRPPSSRSCASVSAASNARTRTYGANSSCAGDTSTPSPNRSASGG